MNTPLPVQIIPSPEYMAAIWILVVILGLIALVWGVREFHDMLRKDQEDENNIREIRKKK